MTENTLPLARDWPGKSGLKREHPAIWHMLDVAACAERLIEGHGAFAARPRGERRAFVVLAALHDVGKISETFRALIRERRPGAYRHWKLSDVLLTRVLDPIVSGAFGGDIHARGELYAAVSGHHGGPGTIERPARDSTANERHRARCRESRGGVGIAPAGSAAGRFAARAHATRRAAAKLGALRPHDRVGLGGVEPGLVPPAVPSITPTDYLSRARTQAAHAVALA